MTRMRKDKNFKALPAKMMLITTLYNLHQSLLMRTKRSFLSVKATPPRQTTYNDLICNNIFPLESVTLLYLYI